MTQFKELSSCSEGLRRFFVNALETISQHEAEIKALKEQNEALDKYRSRGVE